MSYQWVWISFTLYWSNPAANFLFCGWRSGTGVGQLSTCLGIVVLWVTHIYFQIQFNGQMRHDLLSACGSFCWLLLFSLSWSLHGEKLSSGNRMSALDKELSSVRFPRDQRTEVGHLFNLALGRTMIEQISVLLLKPCPDHELNPTLSLIYQCVLNRAWWWMWRGFPTEAQLQFQLSSAQRALGSDHLAWRVREAEPCKHCRRLSTINSKVWPSRTDLQGVEESLSQILAVS